MAQFPLDSYHPETATSVAIGVFDGVHLGHLCVLQQCRLAAERSRLQAVCLTFDPHPALVLAPSRAPAYICSLSQRVEIMQESGYIDDVVVAPFTQELAQLSAQAFTEEVLVGRLNVAHVCVGADFRYGRDRAGSVMDLESAGDALGFRVEIVHAVAIDALRISSTSVRRAIAEGDIARASALLGRDFAIRGTVSQGKQLGRAIGFPTINLTPEASPQLLPADGVYSGYTRIAGSDERVRSAISIGTNPTTDCGASRKIEAHLLDGFDRDLYGARVDISFVGRLREQRRYQSLEMLIEQIEKDVERVRNSVPMAV